MKKTTVLMQGALLAMGLSLAACGSSGKSSNKTFTPNGPPPGPIAAPEPTSLDATCANVMTGPYEPADSLKVPTNVMVEEDDNSVRLSWNGPTAQNPEQFGLNVEGYRVCWGRADQGFTNGALFNRNIGTLFGVANGIEHVAVIQAVDYQGRVSAPSEVVRFKGDPSRVNMLRQQMTAFFDDFNTPDGALDELKWNTAFTGVDPLAAYTHVSQYKAAMYIGNHTQMENSVLHGGRGQSLVRPRAIFDFQGREGRIVFDMPGTFSPRVTWYLDILPYEKEEDISDMTGHATFDPGPGHPGRFLRFSQSGSIFRIHQHDAQGNPIHLLETDRAPLGMHMPMRHVELRVSKNRAAVYIDGELILENEDIELDFERGVVQMSLFAYNIIKIHQRWARMDFDNFGFDGPPPTVVTHNYKTSFNYTDQINSDYYGETTWEQPIPDPIDNARSIRFFYTVNKHQYYWGHPPEFDPGDRFVINGQTFPFPEPVSDTGLRWEDGWLGNDDQPFSTSFELPPGLLNSGPGAVNTFTLLCNKCAIENPHVEVYFDRGTEPSFTQPTGYLAQSPIPKFDKLGPFAEIAAINGDKIYPASATEDGLVNYEKPLSGTVTFNLRAMAYDQILGTGRNLGISRVELLVDGVPVVGVDTDAAVAAPEIDDGPVVDYQPHTTRLNVELDTTQYPNGEHRLEVRAYDSAGTVGYNPSYKNLYYPVTFAN